MSRIQPYWKYLNDFLFYVKTKEIGSVKKHEYIPVAFWHIFHVTSYNDKFRAQALEEYVLDTNEKETDAPLTSNLYEYVSSL